MPKSKRTRYLRQLDPMANKHRFETTSTVTGTAMSAEELIGRISKYSWAESLIRLSSIAALVANSKNGTFSEAVRVATIDPLTILTGSDETLIARVHDYVRENRNDIVVVHEQGVSMLQHLVLLAGKDDGDGPGGPEISLWLLGANEHLDEGGDTDPGTQARSEALVAMSARALRFNQAPDLLRELVRVFLLFSHQPARGHFANPSAWQELQAEAFGATFADYFQSFVFPIAVLSKKWCTDRTSLPLLDTTALNFKDAGVTKNWTAWTREMSATRPDARSEIRTKSNGLPADLVFLLHKPFIEVATDRFVCTSPWAMVTQVKYGLWSRWLEASKRMLGVNGADAWFTTFGDSFEWWCSTVALEAKRSQWFRGTLILPSSPGASDEVEDVVLVEGRAAALFSVKGRLVPESVSRRSGSHSDLIEWYDEYFFGQPKGKHRAGVLRQLSKRVDLIRGGDFESQVPSKTRILPVVVTYDTLAEDVHLYRWIAKRCEEEGLLQQKDVGPVTLAAAGEYEELMTRAANRESVVGILRKRESSFQDRRLDALLFATRRGRQRRLGLLDETFNELLESAVARLRGASVET